MPDTKKRDVAKDVGHWRAKVAGLKRAIRNGERPADDGALAEAERNLAAANFVESIVRIVDGAPPLTDRQREKLAALLRTS